MILWLSDEKNYEPGQTLFPGARWVLLMVVHGPAWPGREHQGELPGSLRQNLFQETEKVGMWIHLNQAESPETWWENMGCSREEHSTLG